MWQLDGKDFEFKRITTQDALKCKNAIFVLARENASLKDIIEANEIIDKLAFKYLRVKDSGGQWLENLNTEAFEALFENELASIEITTKFQEHISSFLNALPTYQQHNQKGKA